MRALILVRNVCELTNGFILLKFLTGSSVEAAELTETLLSIVRQQRHLGTRTIIATQEPTVSPALLDLCNVTIIHRFTSLAWFKAIEGHLAGATMAGARKTSKAKRPSLFQQIVQLATGEAFVFCPAVLLGTAHHVGSITDSTDGDYESSDCDSVSSTNSGPRPTNPTGVVDITDDIVELGSSYIRLKIRERITSDGGQTLFAQ